MSEIISHVPSAEELRRPESADLGLVSAQAKPESFAYHFGEHAEADVASAILAIEQESNIKPSAKLGAIEVLASGTLAGTEVGFPDVIRNNYGEVEERKFIAGMLLHSPDAAKAIVENDIGGFHATRSSALAGILETGSMLTTQAQRKRGRYVSSGEHISQKLEGQASISFTSFAETKHTVEQYGWSSKDVRDTETVKTDLQKEIDDLQQIAGTSEGFKGHASLLIEDKQRMLEDVTNNPKSLFATLLRHDFPVAFGITKDFVRQAEETRITGHLKHGQSYYGEFRPAADEISLEALPVVAVPKKDVRAVTKLFEMFGHPDTVIIPIEALIA